MLYPAPDQELSPLHTLTGPSLISSEGQDAVLERPASGLESAVRFICPVALSGLGWWVLFILFRAKPV